MRRSYICLAVLLLCSLHEFGGSLSTIPSAKAEAPGTLAAFNRNGGSVGECPLQHTAVLAEISGILSSVTVTQRLGNPFREPIEALYTFPLPQDAAVNEMTIHAGERVFGGGSTAAVRGHFDASRMRHGGVVGGVPGRVVGGMLCGVVPPPPPPPPRPSSGQAIRVGGNVQESKLLHRVEPLYPELARRARISGVVIMLVTVDEKGDVVDVQVVRGHPLFNDAAVQAVWQWKYAPTLLNGSPVPVIVTVTVAFGPNGRRMDQAVAMLIERVRTKAPPDRMEAAFVHDGKAELELTLQGHLEPVMRSLFELGFKVIGGTHPVGIVVGRMPVEKVGLLLEVEGVRYIAPHRRPAI